MQVLGYVRVSTDEQGRSGIGLEAQRQAITAECERRGWQLVETVEDVRTNVESGVILSRALAMHPRVFSRLYVAMVEAGEGVAIIPSFVLPACRNRRVVMSKLVNLVVNLDFSRISLRGKKLPPGADDFTTFLQGFIARWAGRAGIL